MRDRPTLLDVQTYGRDHPRHLYLAQRLYGEKIKDVSRHERERRT